MPQMDQFKLAAFDEEDLAVLSMHLQGAVVKSSDLVYLPREKRFALIAERVPTIWTRSTAPERGEICAQRRLTGLHFERVLKVASRGIDLTDPNLSLEVVALRYQAISPPAGHITLLLTLNRDIRLEVECIEAACLDLGLPECDDATGKMG